VANKRQNAEKFRSQGSQSGAAYIGRCNNTAGCCEDRRVGIALSSDHQEGSIISVGAV